jgi:hypothetical protein
MANTYPSAAAAAEDKARMEAFQAALNASPSTLRRDQAGLWILRGSRGYVSSWGGVNAWQLIPESVSARRWSSYKSRLAFCQVTQDGDTEGVLRLDRLPTAEEAVEIREILGLRKRIELSEDQIAERTARLRANLA